MNSLGEDFILKNIPILFGAALFLLLTYFNPITKRYVLTHHSSPLKSPDTKTEIPESATSCEQYLSDRLLINGLGVHKGASLRKISFEKLGNIQIRDLPLFLNKPTGHLGISVVLSKSELWLFAHSTSSLSPTFGYLLPYLLDGSLKLVIL
ncbi:MAG: hypothetical protein KGH53_02700 [Candidatus Micrarchaeota archaeon]|nr:hypothetical protein [Candidatus Micrarchaeota archaeon]